MTSADGTSGLRNCGAEGGAGCRGPELSVFVPVELLYFVTSPHVYRSHFSQRLSLCVYIADVVRGAQTNEANADQRRAAV